ncbi:MAG TPA: tripartite tricarboxylate transporter substrate binding protein [Pseudolabrys sp.]|nr:tripartite tricarboxylate transporter substrate binding protein [Pseudolabrys sp.]
MQPINRRTLIALAGLGAACLTGNTAGAETYPSRPITVLVPFAAGGGVDLIARLLTQPLQKSLGQPVIVENMTGAGGTLAVSRVVHAAPDGYTLSLGDQTSHVSSSAIFPVRYDVLRDLEPVAMLTSNPQVFVGRSTLAAKDLPALLAWLKDNPGRGTLGLPGTVGSGGHLTGIEFQNLTKTRLAFIPYQHGGGQAILDLVGGHVDLLFVDASSALPYIRSGQVRAYGIASTHRWAAAPEIPTMAENGVPLQFSLWRGLWAPKGTPKDVIAKLNAAVVAAFADPGVRERIAALGQEIPPAEQQTPTALATFQRAQTEKWWPIIKAANISNAGAH